MAKPHLEQLEARMVFAGFGPQDGAYIVELWNGSYSAVKIQPSDNRIVTAGTFENSTDKRFAIARYDSLGIPDSTYGEGTSSIPPLNGISAPALGASTETGWDLALTPDGTAVVAGNSTGNGFAVARFNSSGSLDNGFGSGGWTGLSVSPDGFNPAEGVGLQSNGKIVAAGTKMFIGGSSSSEVARFTANGTLDSGVGGFGTQNGGYTLSTFGMNNNVLHDLAVQPDDKLVGVGLAYNDIASPIQRSLIVARYTSNGVLDTTFNGNGYSTFRPLGISDAFGSAVALQTDGKIVVTGFCTGSDGASDMLVARYNTNGSLDISFGRGSGYVRLDDSSVASSTEYANDVIIQTDGKIVLAGMTSVLSGQNKVLVARFNADGTPDATFASGGFKIGSPLANTGYHSFTATGVGLQSDGNIIVAGYDNWSATSGEFHPMLMRFSGASIAPTPAVMVIPTSVLITTEIGGQTTLAVSLVTQPTADVVIPVSSSDLTEGTVSTSLLTFTVGNWNVPQTVTITGRDDTLVDGDIAYSIVLGALTSVDPLYAGIDPTDVSVANIDNDTKFYVVNDATQDVTYEYTASGGLVESYSLNTSNASPRGAASTAAGDKVWVIDSNRKVYVYNASGGLVGSWTAGSMAGNATPEGIATNGIDVWIVDSRSDKVYKYAGAAARLSGNQNATSSFNLNSGNTAPKDIVTDGKSLWVVNDSTTDAVFKYSVAGSFQGSWTISTSGASSPTGITINPANVSTIWIVDNATKLVYQYDAAATLTSGSLAASLKFALAAGNTNPQGIADPPQSASLNTAPAYFFGNNNVLAASTIASSFSQARTSSQSVSAVTESVDEFMSQLADSVPVAPISMSKVSSTPLSSRTRLAEYQSIDLALADEELNNPLHTMANDLLLSKLR